MVPVLVIEYGEYAPRLMRRARQGNMEAVEKVLWLDKTAIDDPRIAREWQEASRQRSGVESGHRIRTTPNYQTVAST